MVQELSERGEVERNRERRRGIKMGGGETRVEEWGGIRSRKEQRKETEKRRSRKEERESFGIENGITRTKRTGSRHVEGKRKKEEERIK